VHDHLVSEEVEIHPFVGAAPFRAAEQAPVEFTGGGEIVDRDGEVERLGHRLLEILRGDLEQHDDDTHGTSATTDHGFLLSTLF